MQPMRVTSFSAVELARQCVSGFLNSGIGGQYILEFEEDTPRRNQHHAGKRRQRTLFADCPRGLTVRAVIPAS